MRLCEQLQKARAGYLTIEQLRGLAEAHDEEDFFFQIQECMEYGLLSPVKKSPTNGNLRFPLRMKYRITHAKAADNDVLYEIRALHSALQRDGFLLKHPEQYRNYSAQLQALSRWLFRNPGQPVAVSRKERSFEIFDEEKQMEDAGFQRLLHQLGIGAERLACYDTPGDSFHDFIPVRKPEMFLLICENKDIWYNLRRMIFEKKKTVLWGQRLDGVLYGQGNQAAAPNSLTEYTRFLGLEQPRYLYWGDIDREGLRIYLRLREVNPELSVTLFLPGYIAMLRRAEGRRIPKSQDMRDLGTDFRELYALFPERWRDILRGMIEDNRRIPQEIISFAVLLQEMAEA